MGSTRNVWLALVWPLLAAVVGGCAVPQPQDTPVWQRRELDPVSGRAFWIYVPSTYTHARAFPVIITCHGTPPYDIAEHHIREWKMLGERYGCIIVAPELIATDGPLEIRAPCDRCTIFMPARVAIVGREGVYLTKPLA